MMKMLHAKFKKIEKKMNFLELETDACINIERQAKKKYNVGLKFVPVCERFNTYITLNGIKGCMRFA